jgi:hypothetical protein
MKKLLAGSAGIGLAAVLAVPATAYATGTAPVCTVVHDHITKTDSGHGSPAEWADLSLRRATKVCGDEKTGYEITLTDKGSLWTRPGAGTPNGAGGQIARRAKGAVDGTYTLTATGGKLAHRHGNTTAGGTDYVKSLFSEGTTVTGGGYSWTYATQCEKWVDASSNNDGQGEQAGNITGKRCPKPTPTPTPTETSSTPTPSPTDSTPPGEAPVPTPVPSDLPVTG